MSKVDTKEYVARMIRPLALKLGHRLVCIKYSGKRDVLTAKCKRCKWRLVFTQRRSVFASSVSELNSSVKYLTTLNFYEPNFGLREFSENIINENICPKINAML